MDENLLNSAVSITRPIIELAVTILGPILITWLSVKLAAILNIKEDKVKAALEKALRDALHASSQNAWLYALKTLGLSFTDLKGLEGSDLLAAVNKAKEYVRDKNPDTIAKLGVTDQQLEDILITKLPSASQL